MIFMDIASDIFFEKIMQNVPNFKQRGSGVIISSSFSYTSEMCQCQYCRYYSGRKTKPCKLNKCRYINIRAEAGAMPQRQILMEALSTIKSERFQYRLNEYLWEGGLMKFWSIFHQKAFKEACCKINCNNYTILSALYLLTAKQELWRVSMHHIAKNKIFFEEIKLKGANENSYTLYCAAKDLSLGTKHLSINDLADKSLISPILFGMICNAMAIHRYGSKFLNKGGENQ